MSPLVEFVGEVATAKFEALPEPTAMSLLAWVVRLRGLSDLLLTGETVATLSRQRLPEFLATNRKVDEFKEAALLFEGTRRHLERGHEIGCGKPNTFDVALHQVNHGERLLGSCSCLPVPPGGDGEWKAPEERRALFYLRKKLRRSRTRGKAQGVQKQG